MKTLYYSLSLSCTHETILLLIYKNVIHKNVNTFTYATRNKRPLIGKRKKLRCGYKPHSVFFYHKELALERSWSTSTVFNPFFDTRQTAFSNVPLVNLSKGKNSWWLWSLPYSSETHAYIYGLKKGTKNRKAHFVSDQNCSDLVRQEHLVPRCNKRKIICKFSLMKSFQRSEENKHAISYSRNIHMILCLKKKQNKTGWFSMCKALKINSHLQWPL